MKLRFRPWYTEDDKARLTAWAKKQAKGNEITIIEVVSNVYGDDVVRMQFKTATEKQKQYGYFDICTRSCAIWKLPKKYQPTK